MYWEWIAFSNLKNWKRDWENPIVVLGYVMKLPDTEHRFATGSCGRLLGAFRLGSGLLVRLSWKPLPERYELSLWFCFTFVFGFPARFSVCFAVRRGNECLLYRVTTAGSNRGWLGSTFRGNGLGVGEGYWWECGSTLTDFYFFCLFIFRTIFFFFLI